MDRALLATLLACSLLFAGGSADAKQKRSKAVLREFQIHNPCPSTGRQYGPCPGYIKDHVVPLCSGGPDAVSNLAWQTIEESKVKDRDERRLCNDLRRKK